MAKFKVGDRVKCVRESYNNFPGNLGDIFTIKEVRPNGSLIFIGQDELYSCDPIRFELVDFPQSELEELVKKANERSADLRALVKKYSDQLERRACDIDGVLMLENWTNDMPVQFTVWRIKPKKQWTPITLNGWTVTVDGDSVKVGCKEFDRKTLTTALVATVKNNSNNYCDFFSSRTGVRFMGHVLPWSDAETLLKALEDYTNDK